MRKQLFVAVLTAALTFFTLQLTIGNRYWGAYGWRAGGFWHRPYYPHPYHPYDRGYYGPSPYEKHPPFRSDSIPY